MAIQALLVILAVLLVLLFTALQPALRRAGLLPKQAARTAQP